MSGYQTPANALTNQRGSYRRIASGNHPIRRPFAFQWSFLMDDERNSQRTAVVLFAVAVILAALLATLTTLERVDKRTASNETPPGTTGLAKPRPPLDRAPGKPVIGN
jgi:hypothetical protein